MYYVYRHRTETDNRVFYVGCGKKSRAFNTYNSNRSKEWLDVYQSEGLIVEILHIIENKDEALELEELLIQEYGRIIDGGTLVNKALFKGGGGIKGVKRSDETKQKISESRKGKQAWNKGKKMSDDFKEKCKNAKTGNTYRKGVKLSEETKEKMNASKQKTYKPILQFDLNMNLIQEYEYFRLVEEKGYWRNLIRDAIKNNKPYKDSYWFYK